MQLAYTSGGGPEKLFGRLKSQRLRYRHLEDDRPALTLGLLLGVRHAMYFQPLGIEQRDNPALIPQLHFWR